MKEKPSKNIILCNKTVSKITQWLEEKQKRYGKPITTYKKGDQTYEVTKELVYSKKETSNDLVISVVEYVFVNEKGREKKIKHESKFRIFFPYNQDHFSISARISFDESDRKGFIVSPKKVKDGIRNNMKIPLLSLNLGYQFHPSPENFDKLIIEKIVYFDGFSKNIYYNTVDSIKNAYDLASTFYNIIKKSIPKGDSTSGSLR